MSTVPERDWKKFRSLQAGLLAEACERILIQVHDLIEDEVKGSHERYRALFKMMRKRDREIDEMFDDPKRSNAIHKLTALRHYGLLNDEMFEQFSEETRTSIESLLSLWKT